MSFVDGYLKIMGSEMFPKVMENGYNVV